MIDKNTWPYNFVAEILGEEFSPSSIPDDFIATFNYLIHSCLKERDIEMVKERYSNPETTLQEIGDRHGISRERVRQITKKCKLRMSHSARKEILLLGIKNTIKAKSNESYTRGFEKGIEISAGQVDFDPDSLIEIETLVLKPRTYNQLKRAGINSVGDIKKLSQQEILALPNIGKTSLFDLVSALREKGISL